MPSERVYVECLACDYVGTRSARRYDAEPQDCRRCGARVVMREVNRAHRCVDLDRRLTAPILAGGRSFFKTWG